MKALSAVPPHEHRPTALAELALARAHAADDAIRIVEPALHPHQRAGADRLRGLLRARRIMEPRTLREVEVLAEMGREGRCCIDTSKAL
jgi:hypothetical protein